MGDWEEVRSAVLTVRAECPRCALPVPIDAPVKNLVCGQCQNGFSMSAETWGEILGAADDAITTGGAAGGPTERVLDGIKLTLGHRAGEPACPGCQAPYPKDAYEARESHDFACPSCGRGACAYPAPSWLPHEDRTVRKIIVGERGAEALARGTAIETPHDVKPVVMSCPQCGAALHVSSKSERTLPCQYCKAEVFLPDELWRRLHPVKTITPFFALFQGRSRAVKARIAREEEQDRLERHRGEEAARHAQQRSAAIAAHAAAEQEAREVKAIVVDAAKQRAYVAVAIQFLLLVVGVAWVWLAPVFVVREPVRDIGITLAVLAAIATLVGVALAARPIQLATDYGGGAMLFVAWFFLIYGFVMPGVGAVMCLVVAIKRFLGTLGGNTVTVNGSSTYYPKIQLQRGESYPLGFSYLAFSLLWQPMLLRLFNLPK